MKDLLNGLPIWAKLSPLAMLNVVLIFLLAQSAGWIPSEVRAMNDLLKQRRELFDQHVKEANDLASSIKVAMRIMCENAARDEQQRRYCENIR